MKSKKLYLSLSLLLSFISISNVTFAYEKSINLNPKPVINTTIITNNIEFTTLSSLDMKEISPKIYDTLNALKQEKGFYIFDNKTYDIKDDYTYVMISCGPKSSSGYGIDALSVNTLENITTIKVNETYPDKKLSYLTVITYPYVIVKFKGGTSNIVVTSENGAKFMNLSENNETSDLTDKNWTDIIKSEKVDKNKVWKITFSKPLNQSFLTNKYIYVKDSKENIISTSIALKEDNKTLEIKPLNNYLPGETYYIFINTKEYEKNNKTSNNGYRIKFTINKPS